jgi:Mrp family chromosome partitioning ATPase
MRTYFDESLPMFAAIVHRNWGQEALTRNFFLRDIVGRLSFVVLDEERKSAERAELSRLVDSLAPYVGGDDLAVVTPDELFDDRLRDPVDALQIWVHTEEFSGYVRIVDRRVIGGDWLRPPKPEASGPVRISFSSIKGGVGRSTALCVAASDLAAQGKRVLTLDLDIEAPGLGNMLLSPETLPRYGLLDYLAERPLGELPEDFYLDMVSTSWIGRGLGRVDVIPAIGKVSVDNPANVLAKISRAYLGDAVDGATVGFSDRIESLLGEVVKPFQYDVILIDARAGLHETTAAAVTGLGAFVLLFGIDQPQTIAGYRLLASHLSTLPVDPQNDWRERLFFVQAKTIPSVDSDFELQVEDAFSSFANGPYEEVSKEPIESRLRELQDVFQVEWSDSVVQDQFLRDLTPTIVSVLEDERLRFFDPCKTPSQLEKVLYQNAYEEFIELVWELVSKRAEV